MAKEIKIYNFDELSPEAQKVAIEKVRDDYYNSDRGQDFAEWATDDDYLFEPNHDEMVALFGKDFKVVPNSKYGGEPMIGNTRKKLYWSLDRNRHIDADEAIEINNREMFLTWLGIPKEMQEKVYFKITDNGSRDADTIIEFEPNESDYEFTSEENKILTDAEKKFSDHMDSVLDRIEADIDYRHTDEAIREDIEANDHYQFFKSGKIARGFSSEDEMKHGGTMKNRFKTNPIESLSTRELAEKAGVTMFDVRKHNMTREDLIAMVSEGNYAKGGGVGELSKKEKETLRVIATETVNDLAKKDKNLVGEVKEKLIDQYTQVLIEEELESKKSSTMAKGGGLKQKSAQYGHKNYGVGDRQKHAKPVGYRYRKIRDPKTGKIRVVTKDDHQYYKSPSMKMIRDYEEGDKMARKMLYFEDRVDHSDKAPLRSLAKYAKGGSVTIEGKKAKYQVKYNLDGKEKIGYIVPIMTPSGHAIDIYYLYDKNKKLVKELRVAEANQLVKDKKIVNVKTYDVPMERLETDIEKSVKDMDYSERRNWIQDHIIPHLKSASLSWRDYQGGWYDYNDAKEEEKFLKDARTNADYKNEEDFNKNSGFKIAEDGWGISTKEGEDLEEVSSDNTYNWSYLGLVTWNIRIYQADEEKFFLIAHPHKGGDVRGNYGDPIIFEDDSEESVMYKFREQVIDGNRVVSLEFKGGVNFTFDAEQDSDVDYFKLNDEPEKLKIGSPAELTLSTWKTFGGWHGDEFLTTIVDEFEREHPKKKKKECGGDIEMKDGGALQSLTTGQLATKAGMTMKEVHKFGYDRDDLIAMITEGNYGKGGGVGNEKEIQERLEYLRGELRAERISQGELIELQSLAKHIDPSDVELLEAAGVPEGGVGSFDLKEGRKDEWVNESGQYLIVDMGNEFQAFDLWQEHNPEDSVIASDEDFDSLVEKIFEYHHGEKYFKGGRLKQKREQYTADNRGIDKYGERDNSVRARPVGYRYRKIYDKHSGRLRSVNKDDAAYYKTPSMKDIRDYENGDKSARKRIYTEYRRDHSDKNTKSNRGY